MACYKFTYKDVLKRYERIINKPSKFEIRLLVSILLIITIVNITSLCFATEDVNSFLPSYNIPSQNIGVSSGTIVEYTGPYNINMVSIPLEKGKSYTITIDFSFGNDNGINRKVSYGFVDSTEIGSSVYNITSLDTNYGSTFSTTFTANGDYLILVASPNINNYSDSYTYFSNDYVSVVEAENMNGAVSKLVDNVGISQIWDVFDTGIGFVGVVVLVAFGIFLVVIAIRKIQKGKSDF